MLICTVLKKEEAKTYSRTAIRDGIFGDSGPRLRTGRLLTVGGQSPLGRREGKLAAAAVHTWGGAAREHARMRPRSSIARLQGGGLV